MAAAFNRIYYNDETGEPAMVQDYQRLFQNVYQYGFRNLQTIAGNRMAGGNKSR